MNILRPFGANWNHFTCLTPIKNKIFDLPIKTKIFDLPMVNAAPCGSKEQHPQKLWGLLSAYIFPIMHFIHLRWVLTKFRPIVLVLISLNLYSLHQPAFTINHGNCTNFCSTACPRKSGPQQMEYPPTNSVLKKVLHSYHWNTTSFSYPMMKMCVRLAR